MVGMMKARDVSKRRGLAASAIGLLCMGCMLFAADPEPRWRILNKASREAAQANDYVKLRQTLIELKPLMPGNPLVTYNLAASNAKLGHRADAIAGLQNLAGMGLVYDLAADTDFATLLKSPDFVAVQTRMEANKKPVSHATPAFKVAEADFIPEDIAYDSKTKKFYISSVRTGKIVSGDGTEFAKAEWSTLALAVDVKRRVLWATTAWVPHCERCDKADEGKTALLKFSLDTGKLEQRIESPVKGLLGDMTISRDGTIYVSEGISGAVLSLPQGAKEFQRLDVPGEFPSPQNPALSADERTLYVADYLRGIAAIDLKTRSVRWLKPADDIALNGIDGLYVYRDSFLAVQNGTKPNRIMRFSLDLRTQETLESNAPGLGEPTHGTLVGDSFYFIANTGWSQYDEHGKKKAGSEPVQSEIRQIRLTDRLKPDVR